MTSTTTGLPDRYRPISQVGPDEETATGVIRSWRARDRVLNRDVALRVHTPGGAAAREWITRALTAGGLATPALSMVYDAAEGTGSDGPGGAAYVVNEWLEGVTLRDLLAADGPMSERDACALVRRLAEGVAEAHRVGLAVGGLTPDHVVVRPSGLAGLLSVPAATGTVQGDIAALGELLELALTGSSGDPGSTPAIDSPDLAALVRRARSSDPAARLSSAATMVALLAERPRTGPQAVGRPESLSDSGWVRRLRDRRDPDDEAEAGDDRTVSADRLPRPMSLNRSALPPVPPPSAAGRPGAAGRWPVDEGESDLDWGSTFTGGDGPSADPEEPSVRRRLAVVGLPLLALVLVVAFAVWFGKNVLSVASSVEDNTGSTPPATVSASAPAGPSASAPAPTSASPSAPAPPAPAPIADAAVFDPYGDGASENGRQVPLSHDGNPVTTWSTVTYRGSADFGRLKPGVGIRYDLGDPQQLTGVTIATVQPGTTVEVRTADSAGGSLADYPVAATARLTGSDQLTFAAPVTARYLLVWVTGLVATGDGFTGSLAEVTPLKAG